MAKRLVILLSVLLLVNFQGCKTHDNSFMALRSDATGEPGLFTTQEVPVVKSYVISSYDDIMIEVGEQEGHDWRMIAAIAYCESRFRNDIKSSRGAQGLMQIMPIVAKQFGVPQEQVTDPQTNVLLAVKLINKIDKMLGLDKNTPYIERMKFVLASYNSGIGHVSDARKLARKYGADPNCWEDVAHYLTLKADPEIAADEVVRHGQLKGGKGVIAFVNQVVGKYTAYCSKEP